MIITESIPSTLTRLNNKIAEQTRTDDGAWSFLVRRIIRGDEVKLLCFGDSLTQGEGVTKGVYDYPAQLGDILSNAYKFSNVTVVNKGVSGNDAVQMLARFETDVVAENPDGIIIMAGMNDIRKPEYEPNRYAENMSELFTRARAEGYAILSLGITQRWRTNNNGYDYAQPFRDALERVVETFNIKYIDMYKKISGIVNAKNGFCTQDITYDGVHYTEMGYRQIAGAVFSFAMSGGDIARKVGENIEPFGGHLVLPADNTLWEYRDGYNAINNSRLLFKKDNTSAPMTLMLWVDDYVFCDLVGYVSRQENQLSTATRVICANRAMSDTLPITDNTISINGFFDKTVFGAPLVLETLQAGWNSIQINLADAGTEFYIDGFAIRERQDGVDRIFNERTQAGVRETYYETQNTDADTKISVSGVGGVLVDGANRKIGVMEHSANYPDYYAFYMQLNHSATTTIKIGRELTDNNIYGFFYELVISAGDNAGELKAQMFLVYRDDSRKMTSEYVFTSTDMETRRLSIGQSGRRVNVYLRGFGLIADSDMVIGISDINLSVTGGDVYISELFRYPKNVGGVPVPTAPLNGERYVDIVNKQNVVAMGGDLYASTMVAI